MAASTYQVSGLAAYTKDDANQLMVDFIYSEVDTLKYMTKVPDIKSAQRLNKVVIDPIWQDQACGWNPSGDTTFSQATLTVGDIAVQLDWCEKQLEPKYIQEAMKPGSNLDMLTYKEIFMDEIKQQINMRREEALWLGDTNSGSQFLNKYDGLIKNIAAASGVLTYSGTTWSKANARTVVTGIVDKIQASAPDVIAKGTVKLFMSPYNLYQYRQKLIEDNLYHMTGKDATMYDETGTIEIIPVRGLRNRSGYIYAIEPENMFYGTDLLDEANKMDLWWSQDSQKVRFLAQWKEGTQVFTGTRIVQYLGV